MMFSQCDNTDQEGNPGLLLAFVLQSHTENSALLQRAREKIHLSSQFHYELTNPKEPGQPLTQEPASLDISVP